MHDAPIYAQLISERGDIPLQVRTEARRIQRELEWILHSEPASDRHLPRLPAASPPTSPPRQLGSGSPHWFA
ncbi:hypothetical protein ACFYP4_08560 [Streptomyces sp. NPDC005551]|uniref:hypothetical protein n=1 Tax=unclassified Streptomyces TaxID=2593676 RepID=UPI003401EF49